MRITFSGSEELVCRVLYRECISYRASFSKQENSPIWKFPQNQRSLENPRFVQNVANGRKRRTSASEIFDVKPDLRSFEKDREGF